MSTATVPDVGSEVVVSSGRYAGRFGVVERVSSPWCRTDAVEIAVALHDGPVCWHTLDEIEPTESRPAEVAS